MARGRVAINDTRCKGCALCTTVCQRSLLVLDTEVLNSLGYHPARYVDPDAQCTGCTLCAVICPDACITVYRITSGQPARALAPSAAR